MIEKLSDKYSFLNKIGQGGQASVYRAFDKQNNREVAIKIISSDKNISLSQKQRFLSEIKAMKLIKSEHVVQLYDFHFDEEIQYIVMEYINGMSLNDYIGLKGPLMVKEAIDISKKLALGLFHLHQASIVHRDIKPQNIIIDSYNNPKIVDLGISLHYEAARVTQVGKIIGSASYMAPELSNKEDATFASDIYALGILLYEMLIGRPPFISGNNNFILKQHHIEKIPYVSKINSKIPHSITNIINKATVKNKYKRYRNAYDLFKDLETCLLDRRLNEKIYDFNNRYNLSFYNFISSIWFLVFSLLIVIVLIVILIFFQLQFS